MVNVLSLFAGIGGLDLGLEAAGMAVVGQVEIDLWCRRVLAKHWPEVPRHDDVRTAAYWWQSEPRPTVDIVAGGPPCQPVSDAGLKLAQADPRWLWPAMWTVVAALRPTWVVIENVPGLRTRGLSTVLRDLRTSGYRARAGEINACAVGAPHPRRRLFVLAHTEGAGCRPRRTLGGEAARTDGPREIGPGPDRRRRWPDEPGMDRVAYGLPDRVDRAGALGAAVVPQVAEYIGGLILAASERAA